MSLQWHFFDCFFFHRIVLKILNYGKLRKLNEWTAIKVLIFSKGLFAVLWEIAFFVIIATKLLSLTLIIWRFKVDKTTLEKQKKTKRNSDFFKMKEGGPDQLCSSSNGEIPRITCILKICKDCAFKDLFKKLNCLWCWFQKNF